MMKQTWGFKKVNLELNSYFFILLLFILFYQNTAQHQVYGSVGD